MWPFFNCYSLVSMYRLCPFFYFTMGTRIEYMWGKEEVLGWISKRNKNQGALSSCPLLHWGVLVCTFLLCWPIQAELWGPLELIHEPDLLMVETPVLFPLRMFPWLLFQGVSPVCLSCSWRIAHSSCALILGSLSGFLMGLVLAWGSTLPLPPLPAVLSLLDVVACNYCPLRWMSWYRIGGWCFYQYYRGSSMWYSLPFI